MMPESALRADDHISEDDAAAYALGALEGSERDLIGFHIQFCPRCSGIVDRELRTASMLAMMAINAIPAPDIKTSLFARIGQTQRADLAFSSHAITRDLTIPASTPLYTPPAVAPVPVAAVVAAPANRRSGWVGAAMSIPLLAALTVGGFWANGLRNDLQSQASRVNELEAQVANFGSGSTVPLSPGYSMPQAEGKLVVGADDRAAMVQVDLNSDTAAGPYSVMVNQDGQLVPVGEFDVDAKGIGQAQLKLDQPFSSYESISIQPRSLDGGDSQQSMVLTSDYAGLGSSGSELDPLP